MADGRLTMAMEATHVRFARDLAGTLGVTDEGAYYSGAIYPDSRYATGIPREATHDGPACPRNPFAPGLSDFEKGWATHLLYDRESGPARKEALAGLVRDEDQSDGWAFHTALKLVEDMESVRVLGKDAAILRSVRAFKRPLGEDSSTVDRYYADMRAAYEAPCDSPTDYVAFSVKLGIPRARADRMVALAAGFHADTAVRKAILGIYSNIRSHYAR